MNSSKDYIRTVLETIQYSFGELLVSNIFFVLMLLPIITIPPAFAGLYYSTSKLAHNESSTRQTFFEGFKRCFRSSYYWLLILVVFMAVVGVTMYGSSGTDIKEGMNLPLVQTWPLYPQNYQ